MDNETINEIILNKYPKAATIEITTNILEQMKKSICKIHKNNGEKNGTGFFCVINNKNKELKALFTNYHVIDDNYINKNKIIKISLNDEKDIKIIKIGNNDRKIYSNKEYDITIIEIIQKDNINDVNYLTIDENIFKENSEVYCEGKTIYNLSYPNGDKASVSYGILSQIDGYNIHHLCNTDKGSSGSPLLNLYNNKVIGIHKGGYSHFEFNKGILLKEPINKFIYENKNKNQLNEIIIKVNVSEMNDQIYFLDNTKIHNNLNELNKTNVELFINDKKYEFSKCFKPERNGINIIKLKFKTKMKDCSCMFYDCTNIEDIDFSNFNTEEVENMNSMFSGCELREINLSSFNTEKLISMERIFSHCFWLELVDISSFSGANLIYYDKLFHESSSYVKIKINKKFYEKIKSWVPKRFNILID